MPIAPKVDRIQNSGSPSVSPTSAVHASSVLEDGTRNPGCPPCRGFAFWGWGQSEAADHAFAIPGLALGFVMAGARQAMTSRNRDLPTCHPGGSQAQAGIQLAAAGAVARWIPACAGM